MKISAVIVTLNEEKNIERCLKSLSFVDEIVLVDDGSNDKTVEIAKKYTEKIFEHKSEGYVEPARNFAIEKAKGPWILIIDADEEIPASLKDELEKTAKSKDADVLWIPRKNILFGEWIKNNEGWWPDYNPRFFKKGTIRWSNKIHGKPEVNGKEIWLDSKEEYAMVHHNYQTVRDFIERLNRYTDIEAEEENFDWRNITKDQNEEFLSRLFARKGYKDGFHGLVLSYLEAMYSVVLSSKIWEKKGFPKEKIDLGRLENEIKENYKNTKYWLLSVKINETKNPITKFFYRISRKITSL